MNTNFKSYLQKITKATNSKEIKVIQSLWSDYGKISRYQLTGGSVNTVVVKNISLNQAQGHPRGWNTNLSHNRKVKSYQVETHWYKKWNQHSTANCRTPKFLGSYSEDQDQWIVLEDLDVNYPVRKFGLEFSEVYACLDWLANFHATFLGKKPTGLWEIGTYWHLKTRPDEFEKIEHQGLKAKAHLIDQKLNECKFQTIVHGDAKLANFCFSKAGHEVVMVDFQYVGGGCGMKDVAYFLGSCLSSSECEAHEGELLAHYFSSLQKAVETSKQDIDFIALKKEWQTLYPVACTDFLRFMMGWMPSHQKINQYNSRMMEVVLKEL